MSETNGDSMVSSPSAPGQNRSESGSEQRTWERWTYRTVVEITTSPDDLEATWTANMCNLSRGGVGLLSPRPVTLGETIYVRDCTIEEPRVWLTGTVAHCSPARHGWHIGVHIEHTA